ncbi:uncharacterized protein DSM5745_09653 [Aspergillus mulundensis]|uniref:homogentisate 1,2-dioxygenase n=1 Tax=Aspergillus mulundensis TaxID=1810919 RepID=A0A3D8QWK6_9EURO|nr:hypothetical protein DSM5745_09653 [Aspergillus mulundensis]RDW65914.1 hypothetical protein DSM5745_09653 [Aspergillus mulundensis]
MATATAAFTTTPTSADLYTYRVGFGNRFASEAIPGTLPIACNTPQRFKYDLVSEHLNETPFVSSRASMLKPVNENVTFTPQDIGWDAFDIPSSEEPVDFNQGWKTIAGHGDPAAKEALAVHAYMCNSSMDKKAIVNNDGDLLVLPQQGSLDIQTEFGGMMVRPGELAVIQAGMRFKVSLPDGVGRGYIQEIFGSHYELSELGPIEPHALRCRCLARHLRTIQIRTRTLHQRVDHSARPVRPVNLLRVDREVENPGCKSERRPCLHAEMERDEQYIPTAILPPRRRDRDHGHDIRDMDRDRGGKTPTWWINLRAELYAARGEL